MNLHLQLASYLQEHANEVSQVVDLNPATDLLLQFDFTINNNELTTGVIADTAQFSQWINNKLQQSGCRYGIGGYMEHRTLYSRSALFDTDEEPRRLHLGTDIWGPAGTRVYAPLKGTVHSFQNNNNYGDYGPTIILQHNLQGLRLYSLYGHLNTGCLSKLTVGQDVEQGQHIADFGEPHENGSWPPHLHFQLMYDIEGLAGDYPGVGRYSQMKTYRQNIPDPNLILKFSKATIM